MALTWNNQNGLLGNGGQISADFLPTGENIVTLTVQNSAGVSSSKQIKIYVDDPLELPGPTLTLAPSALSFQAEAGATAPISASISLENTGSGALTWSAQSSAAWLALSAASGDVPGTLTATANPTGLQSNMLHQATITLTGVASGYPDQIVTIPVELSIGNSTANPTGSVPQQQTSSIFLPKLSRQ
jgi:PKD repeat protein